MRSAAELGEVKLQHFAAVDDGKVMDHGDLVARYVGGEASYGNCQCASKVSMGPWGVGIQVNEVRRRMKRGEGR